MRKEFHIVNNVFSDSVLDILNTHCEIKSTDKSSYDIWPDQTTNNKTIAECFSHMLDGRDRIMVVQDLYSNPALPCYKKRWIKDANIAIQKIPKGGYITKHRDNCLFGLTVFLNEIDLGGDFIWWDEQDNLHTVRPECNTGVMAYYDHELVRGAAHQVTPVESDQIRYTVQLFVFMPNAPENYATYED